MITRLHAVSRITLFVSRTTRYLALLVFDASLFTDYPL
jgi:hypothetical protein